MTRASSEWSCRGCSRCSCRTRAGRGSSRGGLSPAHTGQLAGAGYLVASSCFSGERYERGCSKASRREGWQGRARRCESTTLRWTTVPPVARAGVVGQACSSWDDGDSYIGVNKNIDDTRRDVFTAISHVPAFVLLSLKSLCTVSKSVGNGAATVYVLAACGQEQVHRSPLPL